MDEEKLENEVQETPAEEMSAEVPAQSAPEFQPEMNAYGDVMNAAPVMTNTPAAPKKKKGLKIALISAACAVAAALIGLVVFLAVRKTPEEAVKQAVSDTMGEFRDADFNPYEDVFGVSEYHMDDMDAEMSFTLDNVLGMPGLSGSVLSLSASAKKNDADMTDFDILSKATFGDETLNVNLYYLKEKLYCELPEICSAVISLNPDNYDPEQYMPEPDSGVQDLFDSYMIPAGDALRESVTYEKVGRTKITNHNEDTVNATQYTMTVPVDAVKNYIRAWCSYMSDYIDQYMTDDDFSGSGYTREDYKEILTQLPDYFSFLFARDFKFDFYIRHNKLVRAEFAYNFSLIGISLDLSLDLMGDDFTLSDVYAACDIEIGDETINVTGTYKQDNSSGELNTDGLLTVVFREEEVFHCTYQENYNIDSEAYSKTVSMSDIANLTNSEYAVQGRIYDVEKGKGFRADFDSITVSYKDEELLKGSAEFAVGDLGLDVVEPDLSNVVSEDEIDDSVLDEIIDMEKLDEILSAWEKAFGTDGMAED